ncbi:MAG TPA: hypothetical protein VG738_11130 [Chitinophagaceae bacterium]|nr:hypothetical protein [Chitinophagaceae bacterium]
MKKLSLLFAAVFAVSSVVLAKPKHTAADSTQFAEYYGKYKFDAGSPVDEAEILWKDTTLVISTAMGDATLDMLGPDSFHMSYEDGIITFKRNDDKKIKSLHISVSGTELDAAREEAAAATTLLRKEDLLDAKKTVAVK